MDIKQQIREAAEKIMGASYFAADVKASHGKPVKITLVLDGDHGVTIDDCAKLSGKIHETLDALYDDYILEVTTPGTDSALSSLRQYKKNVGREVKVQTAEGTIVGKLIAASHEGIEVEWKEKKEMKKKNLLFTEIKNTRVQVSFK
ncbi:MAG: ribosome assembly cofactor RimP [Candidatus Nephrothrix sp. EaCA]|nr:MAG: ribosome assembly cofactor RimP [Candidatus Nephrothrix sp. EaCA]